MTVEKIVNALDTIVFVYDLAGDVVRLRDWSQENEAGFRVVPFRLITNSMVEMIWTLCVELFGDWADSPRAGWIEDIDGFNDFIERITQTARDNKEE